VSSINCDRSSLI